MNNIESQRRRRYEIDEPYVGMPVYMKPYDKCPHSVCDAVDVCPLAMAYVPWQRWCETYEPAKGWDRGTIFPELDLPFLGGGGC
ncbi:MAG: spore coat associated protein CotJA [Bacillota bacterium]